MAGAAVLRAAHPGPALAVTVASGLLAVAAGLDAAWVAVVVAAVGTGQLSIGWSNDLVDLGRDRAAHRSDKPLATGEASPALVRALCVVAVVLCVPLSLACGLVAGGVHLACVVAAGWAYNLGLKSTAWSWVPYAVAFGALPVFVGLAHGGDGFDPWVPLVGALLGVGAHLVNVVPDLEDDAATGVRGLPHRLGARASVLLACVLLATGSVVVVVGSGLGLVLAVAGLLVVGALVAVAALAGGRVAFRAAMAIALVDVVLLAVAL